ncbi:TRAP transporter large permease [Cohaesibacter haloalkalitolerans]|uniref:TRAP transporter large permease n=1 Tax=Cohaesibacter haloalkalitolerans TaxID=1162980 RepID=UPI000E654F76|nr:TRAP transporter large permease [Cohaesibacter haloalkalitolerans]
MDASPALVLVLSFFFLVFSGVPIAFALGISAIAAGCAILPPEVILTIVSQRLVSGLDNFALLAIPFFVLAGVLMNHGGIAARLINLAMVLIGRTPGSLGHVNIVANMLFGSISGSATAAAAAVGGVMTPMQKQAGFPPTYSAAINISSCVTGLLIPPSNVMIIYAVTAGNLSIAALFAAGYVPGILLGGALIVTGFLISYRRGYGAGERATLRQAVKAFLDAIPSLLLVLVIIGGIIGGIFTATEASAIAVLYAFILSVFIYRSIPLKRLPAVLIEASITTGVVLLLVSVSIAMSWVMTRADIPQTVTSALLSVSDNPFVLLLIINLVLIIVGIFMDMTPAILIFTPIFLPVAISIGMDPLHFGIMMIFNLCIGLCTPPVGIALFVGCSVAKVSVQSVIKPLLPFFFSMLVALVLVTAIPELSTSVPNALGLYK